MKLDRKTGNRVPVMNDASEHRSYRDESLRIVSDEEFEAAKAKLGTRTRKRSTVGPARAADLIRTFTGHLFCEHCGSASYSRKSSNAKGTYIYYQCGCRQRRGPEACPNSIALREDKLLDGLREVCSTVFDHIDAMVEQALWATYAVTTSAIGVRVGRGVSPPRSWADSNWRSFSFANW